MQKLLCFQNRKMSLSDKYYFPHLTRTVHKIIDAILSERSECSVNDVVDKILADAPYLQVTALRYRIYTAIKSLEVTDDIKTKIIIEPVKKVQKKIIYKC